MSSDWETLTPVLVHIQANLDQDLSLAALSRKAGLSAFHFQRVFHESVGETPKAYTLRLRLERAAFRLLLHESTILDVALECGFQNHESFSRAFRRSFNRTPREYREWARRRTAEPANAPDATPLERGFEISRTKVVDLRSMHLAFVRHVGSYESVPESIFEELERWAAKRRLPGLPVWLGIGHDAPSTTPPERLRFDAALQVAGPFAPEGRVAYQQLAAGKCAVTTHAGSYETLPEAYKAIFPRLFSLPGYRPVGLPAIEVYHTARVNPRYHLNHTDIYLPVAVIGSA